MKIEANVAGVRYGYSWIFRSFSYTFEAQQSYAILGNNGSGKSTLIKLLSGSALPTEGGVTFYQEGKKVPGEQIHQYVNLVAPYLGLPEELTIEELLKFHSKFRKPFLSIDGILEKIWLKGDKRKEIRQLSSGMKQRLKLGLAFFFEGNLLLLDEPCSHLDKDGIAWYLRLVEEERRQRMLIIASNQAVEYQMTTHEISVQNWKPMLRKKSSVIEN